MSETNSQACQSKNRHAVWVPRAGLFIGLFVILRLTIGWHFLFEGVSKIQSIFSPKPFSSAGYFRESAAPLSGMMQRFLPSDPDGELLLNLEPVAIEQSLRDIGADLASFLKLESRDLDLLHDTVERKLGEALFWREGGNAGLRLAYERALLDWESDSTSEHRQAVLEKRVKLLEMSEKFRLRQDDLAAQVSAVVGITIPILGVAPSVDRLDRVPLDATDSAQVGVVRGSILSVAEKALLERWLGKAEAMAVEQWKKWDKVIGMADKWADSTREWLESGGETVEQASPDGKGNGTLKKSLSTPERVARLTEVFDFREKVRISDRNWDFRKDVDKGSLISAKAAVAAARSSLASELAKIKGDLVTALEKQFADKIATAGDRPIAQVTRPIDVIDLVTIWGITAIGAGLFTGTFTRMAALGGVAFLAMTYLAFPAFPWVPAPPQNEGNYVFINKNVVEMMALMVIAVSPSGRWFGVDAVIWSVFCKRGAKLD